MSREEFEGRLELHWHGSEVEMLLVNPDTPSPGVRSPKTGVDLGDELEAYEGQVIRVTIEVVQR